MKDLNYNLDTSDTKNVLLSFNGDILGAAENLEDLMNRIDEAIAKGAFHCVVDLKQVKFMDSSGLSMLIRLLTKFRNKGGELILTGISSHVEKLLLITKLNSIFEIK